MTPTQPLIIGTRGSDLALWQARFIADVLLREHEQPVEIKIIKTAGDKIQHLSFDKMEGKGFFTKEIEDALLAREVDLAVHSLKDLMTTQPEGLKLGAVGYRADRRELLLVRPDAFTGEGVLPIKADATIGTSSARRKCQIAHFLPTAQITDLRGNVPTRINKLREGEYDAILIARAGAQRLELDLSDLREIPLDPQRFLPAPAQGILGIQIRENDSRVEDVVSQLGSPEMRVIATVERGLLSRFGLGCSLPLGVYSETNGPDIRLVAVLGIHEDDRWTGLRRTEVSGPIGEPDKIIDQAFAELQD